VGQGADGDTICSRCGHGADVFEGDASRHFHDRPSVDEAHRSTDKGGRHIVQQDDIGLSGKGLSDLGKGFRLDDDRFRRRFGGSSQATGCSDGLPGRTQEGEMIVFDQDSVLERHPVVDAAAQSNGPFLQRPPPRYRFPRVHDTDRIASNGQTEFPRQGRDSGQVLEKIQSHPFSLQNRPSVTGYAQNGFPLLGRFTVPAPYRDCKRRINGKEGLNGGGQPGHNERLLRNDDGPGGNRLGKQGARRHIALAEVFFQPDPNGAPDFRGRKPCHRSAPQHGLQLFAAAHEESTVARQGPKPFPMFRNDFRRSLA